MDDDKKKKEYAAKLAAQKKWLESLEKDGKYTINLNEKKSLEEDCFRDYFDQYNGKII